MSIGLFGSNSSRRPSLLTRYLVYVTLGSLLAGTLFLTVQGVLNIRHGSQSAQWPQVVGTIIESRVTSRHQQTETRRVGRENDSPSGRTQTQTLSVVAPVIRYRYEVAGKSYESSRIMISDGLDSPDLRVAESVVAKYSLNSQARVYYHPRDPSLAVLEPGVSSGAEAQVIFGLAFSVFIGGFLLFFCSPTGRLILDDFIDGTARRRAQARKALKKNKKK